MKKLRKNIAGMLALLIILIASFLFPLYSIDAFGETMPSGNEYTAFKVYERVFSNGQSFINLGFEGILQISMGCLLIIIICLYLLNGLGIIKNKFSRYASYFSIFYFVLSLVNYNFLNKLYSTTAFGISLSSVSIGFGTWLVLITGLGYLFFSESINEKF